MVVEDLKCEDCGKIVGTIDAEVIIDEMRASANCENCANIKRRIPTAMRIAKEKQKNVNFLKQLEYALFFTDEATQKTEIQRGIEWVKTLINRGQIT